MAGLRKGSCYKRIKRAYSRYSKYKSKNFLPTKPIHKISKFDMGNLTKKFKYSIVLKSKDSLQIRHNAIESARQAVNRKLENKLGKGYHLKINVFPHHALRENKMLGGAHADRLQTGMSHAFGKVMGAAAQVKKGKVLFTASVDKENIEFAKASLKEAIVKLPCSCSIEVKENA